MTNETARRVLRLALVCHCMVALPGAATADQDEGFVPLFNGRDLNGWVPVNVAPGTFSVEDGMIVCTGKPTGFMRTERQYENFIVEFEWRHMVGGGNAGFFVWADPLPALGGPFTRSIEVQVLDGHNAEWYTSHGDIFPIWGATLEPDNNRGRGTRAFPTEMRANPSPQWNHYRIECRDGGINLAVNGKVVTTGHKASPRRGYLCLESEGSPVHFRNLRIKELPPANPPLAAEHIARRDEGFRALYTGVDLSGWRASGDGADHWKAADWTLTYNGKASGQDAAIWTDEPLGDCDITLDFRAHEAADVLVLIESGAGEPITLRLAAGQAPVRKGGEWNRLAAKLQRGQIVAAVNGQALMDVPPVPAAIGHVGLAPQGPASFANLLVRPAERR
jgi:hypothetical protein